MGGAARRLWGEYTEEVTKSDDFWRKFPTKSVKDFVADWKEKFEKLEWMPVQDRDGGNAGEIFGEHVSGQDDPKVRPSESKDGPLLLIVVCRRFGRSTLIMAGELRVFAKKTAEHLFLPGVEPNRTRF